MSQNWYSKQIYGFSMGEFKSSLWKRLKKQIYCSNFCSINVMTGYNRNRNKATIREGFKLKKVKT